MQKYSKPQDPGDLFGNKLQAAHCWEGVVAVPACAGKWSYSRQPLEPLTLSACRLTGGSGAALLSMSSTASGSHKHTERGFNFKRVFKENSMLAANQESTAVDLVQRRACVVV